MIANKEGGASPRSADQRRSSHRSSLEPSPTRRARGRTGANARLAALPADTPTATGSASSKATRSSNRNTSCCWPSSAAKPTRSASAVPRTSWTTSSPTAAGRSIPAARPTSAPRSRRTSPSSWWATRPTIRPWCARGRRSSTRAAPRPATASRGSTWRCWARSATTSARAFRPSWCSIPSRLNFSLSAMSAWTRTIVVPLSIMSHFKPVRRLAAGARHRRAVPRRPSRRGPGTRDGLVSWSNFFLGVDRVLKWVDRWVPASWRQRGTQGGPPLDARALRELRRPGRDLPADDLHGRRARVPGLRPRFARGAVGLAAARRPADRRGRPGPAAALRLAGLGHGHRHDRPGRRRPARRRARAGPRRRLAARQGGPQPGRLADAPARRRAERLALPVPQRVLPRHRRHGDGR